MTFIQFLDLLCFCQFVYKNVLTILFIYAIMKPSSREMMLRCLGYFFSLPIFVKPNTDGKSERVPPPFFIVPLFRLEPFL